MAEGLRDEISASEYRLSAKPLGFPAGQGLARKVAAPLPATFNIEWE